MHSGLSPFRIHIPVTQTRAQTQILIDDAFSAIAERLVYVLTGVKVKVNGV